MAQSDAKIKYLEHELDQQEKLIKMIETSGTGVSEDRIARLKRRLRDMEALVKGLTQELLDLKSIAMKMSKQTEERGRQELVRGPHRAGYIRPGAGIPGRSPPAVASSSGSTVIRPKGARQDVPAKRQSPPWMIAAWRREET